MNDKCCLTCGLYNVDGCPLDACGMTPTSWNNKLNYCNVYRPHILPDKPGKIEPIIIPDFLQPADYLMSAIISKINEFIAIWNGRDGK